MRNSREEISCQAHVYRLNKELTNLSQLIALKISRNGTPTKLSPMSAKKQLIQDDRINLKLCFRTANKPRAMNQFPFRQGGFLLANRSSPKRLENNVVAVINYDELKMNWICIKYRRDSIIFESRIEGFHSEWMHRVIFNFLHKLKRKVRYTMRIESKIRQR